MLDWLASLSAPRAHSPRSVVAWHETMSQHFLNTQGSGYFYKPVVDDQELAWRDGRVNLTAVPSEQFIVPTCCSRITNTSFMADWRNDIVKEQLKQRGRAEKIHYLPFADMTR